MKKPNGIFLILCMMVLVLMTISSCNSQRKLGCPMKITQAVTKKSGNC
ncbi:MAG: hypothetical protein ACYCOO_06965 [Chitinophagaceae bacterium]